MSQENVEIVRRAIEGFNQTGEFDYSTLDPGTVWDLSHSPFPDAGIYRGADGARAWISGIADAFGDFKYEVEKIRDAGAQVVVLLRVIGRGPTSGLAVDYRLVPVFTFHDGKIVRMERFDDWQEALEAVGLSE